MSDQVQVAGFVVLAAMALGLILAGMVLAVALRYCVQAWFARQCARIQAWLAKRRRQKTRDAERHRQYMERRARENAQPLTTAVDIMRAAGDCHWKGEHVVELASERQDAA